MAQQARQDLEARKTGYLRYQDEVKGRLREAKVMECLHLYLKYAEGRGEDMWVPALVRAHQEGYARKTSTRCCNSQCKFCLACSHYNWECDNTHTLCQCTGGSRCRIYPSHINVALGRDTICPFKG